MAAIADSAKEAAVAAGVSSQTPEESLHTLARVLYRHFDHDLAKVPSDEETLLWQCSLLLLKFRSSSRWSVKSKGFFKSEFLNVGRKYPRFGQKVRELAKVFQLDSINLICILQ